MFKERLFDAIKIHPESTDRELTSVLFGTRKHASQVNQEARLLAGSGAIARIARADGRIINVPVARAPLRPMRKYEPLAVWLRGLPLHVQEVTLTMEEMQAILGAPLPPSAFSYRQWWSNQRDATNRPQACAWMGAGFAVDAVNQSREAGRVRYKRT
jgi:hypothetical protein